MLDQPPPMAGAPAGFPRTGQQMAGINYQQPQQFTIPGPQSQTIMKRGITGPLQGMPVSSQGMNPMANALMNPWR